MKIKMHLIVETLPITQAVNSAYGVWGLGYHHMNEELGLGFTKEADEVTCSECKDYIVRRILEKL